MPAKVQTKYEADNGGIYTILLSPDYAAQAGTPPTGVVTSALKVKVSKGNKEFGLRPRGVKLARTVGTAPDTFKKYSFLPVLTPAEFITSAYALGTEITIGGVVWIVVGIQPEDY